MTLVLCGLVVLIPGEGASGVFISLVVSTTMLVLFANCCPYINRTDDCLAQFCQGSLMLAMSVGILEKADESFQDDLFGIVLVIATSLNLTVNPPNPCFHQLR